MNPIHFCGGFVLNLADPYLSSFMFSPYWHPPHLHLGHPAFPSRSGCTSPVAHGREPGCIPGEDGGLGAAGCGILCAEARLCLPPRNWNESLQVLAERA